MNSRLQTHLSIPAALLLLAFSSSAWAVAVECPSDAEMLVPGYERQASVDPALACEFGVSENPDGDTFFGGGWTNAGERNGSNGTNNYLTVVASSWGSDDVTADWAIDPSFWSVYGSAVLSAHVGNGAGDPDWFAWTLPAGVTSGLFTYDRVTGNGGGLSNIKLWGRDEPTVVAEPMTTSLIGLGLLALGFLGRRRSTSL